MSDKKTYTLGDLGRVVTGKTPPSSSPDWFGDNHLFLTPVDYSASKYIEKTVRGLSEKGFDNLKSYCLPENTICVTCIGSGMGETAILKKSGISNQQINSIIINDKHFSYNYIYYHLKTLKRYLKDLSGGSAVPILNKSAFSKVKIQVPPLPEQKAIATILSSFDDKIELNNQMNKTLEEMAQALFHSWFVEFDIVKAKKEGKKIEGFTQDIIDLFPDDFEEIEGFGLVPCGWKYFKFNDLHYSKNNFTVSKDKLSDLADASYPHYGANSILGYYDQAHFNGRYIVMGKDGTVVDKNFHPCLTLVDGKFSANGTTHVIEGSKINTELLYLFLKNRNVSDIISGAVQPHITKSGLAKIKFIIPHDNISAIFGKLVKPFFDKILVNQQESTSLAKTRDALLSKLISGDIRVKDAEKFLKRIEDVTKNSTQDTNQS